MSAERAGKTSLWPGHRRRFAVNGSWVTLECECGWTTWASMMPQVVHREWAIHAATSPKDVA